MAENVIDTVEVSRHIDDLVATATGRCDRARNGGEYDSYSRPGNGENPDRHQEDARGSDLRREPSA